MSLAILQRKDQKVIANDVGQLSLSHDEPTTNLITWVFEEGSFVPQAKIVDGETYSIISDYLGTPILSFDEKGNKVWERELDIYGKVKKGDNLYFGEILIFIVFHFQLLSYNSI